MSRSLYEPARPGLGNTNSYLVSGIPYITGATMLNANFGTLNAQQKIEFPYVARSVTIINTSATDIRVHFNSLATASVVDSKHFITLSDSKDSITFNVKCKEIFVSLAAAGADGTYQIAAELTTIPSSEMFSLTGSGLTDL